jgi:uncharacterized damage-inducible protein DinB
MNLLWIQMTVLLGVVGVSLSHANAQSVPVLGPDKGPTISSVLDEHLRAAEEVIVSTAMAMPEGKYSFVPTNGEFKGVRSFAEEVKHIATANNAFFGTILGGKFDDQVARSNGPDSVKTKAQILQYLRDSYALGHRAIATITAENATAPLAQTEDNLFIGTRLALANISLWHAFDHYGQMVEYLRMNGIIPPLTRSQSN